ncbi:class I SAM-dependent methyltransferase [Candidatus Woesearchaeota archaeon]|nr:class I SAM-dependent methyltransferase [Candidatus Woesearchaeota archaeon]
MAQFDRFAKQYIARRTAKRFNHNKDVEIPNMIKFVGNIRNKKILDLGCGFGDHAKLYIKKGAKKVTGIDASKEMIKIAKERKIPNTEFFIGDLNKKLPFPKNSFDFATASLCIDYLRNLDRFLKEVYRILKPNGVFCFSTPNPVIEGALIKANTLGCKFVKLIGMQRLKNEKIKIFGNYFKERMRKRPLIPGVAVTSAQRTYQTFIQSLLKNNFEIIDYIDCKPAPSSKKIDPEKYELCMRIPTFCMFKVKKK